jgi:hypothetical protein
LGPRFLKQLDTELGWKTKRLNDFWHGPGTDVMILKTFSPKKLRKIGVFIQNKAKLCKKIDHNIGF